MTQEPQNGPEQKAKPKSMELGLGGARNEAIAGFVFLVLIFSGCVYNLGKPWTCEQAKTALKDAEIAKEKESYEGLNGQQAYTRARSNLYQVATKQQKVADLCR